MERFYRRRLPHWRLDAPMVVYFVTWRLAVEQPPLSPCDRDVVASAIGFWQSVRYVLSAWVVMDDHVHVLVAPLEGVRLERLLHSWKSFTAHQLATVGRRTPVWQDESFDRVVRNDAEMQRFYRYVCWNPLKRWPEIAEYRWVWPELRQSV